mmetsp:Transcript_133940/g.189335  ORF Transcript_133940/g.189335 Transcript_133940/m.189335 type:complete len:283 (-) Transcript_133940:106-954(-)
MARPTKSTSCQSDADSPAPWHICPKVLDAGGATLRGVGILGACLRRADPARPGSHLDPSLVSGLRSLQHQPAQSAKVAHRPLWRSSSTAVPSPQQCPAKMCLAWPLHSCGSVHSSQTGGRCTSGIANRQCAFAQSAWLSRGARPHTCGTTFCCQTQDLHIGDRPSLCHPPGKRWFRACWRHISDNGLGWRTRGLHRWDSSSRHSYQKAPHRVSERRQQSLPAYSCRICGIGFDWRTQDRHISGTSSLLPWRHLESVPLELEHLSLHKHQSSWALHTSGRWHS